MCALAWFLFFPNAPYITTDVVHIHDDHVSASWFHLISIMAYAWTGLSLGYLSLYLMQEVVRARFGRVLEWCFVFVMLGAGTVGIYLGRFLRWNSWDVLRHPVGYLRIGYHDVRPFDEPGRSSFIGLMFLFMLLVLRDSSIRSRISMRPSGWAISHHGGLDVPFHGGHGVFPATFCHRAAAALDRFRVGLIHRPAARGDEFLVRRRYRHQPVETTPDFR